MNKIIPFEITKEWHLTKNGLLKPENFTKGSSKDIIGKSLSSTTGEYLITNLPYGTYFISVSMLTFETKTLEVTIDKKLINKDIYLGLNQEFEESDFWKKNANILLIFYLHQFYF